MKSWDALNFYYPGSAASSSNCAVVNAKIGVLVVASLSNQNQQPLGQPESPQPWNYANP
jgi:hypothetical protein